MDTAKDGNFGAPPAYDANGQSSNQTGGLCKNVFITS